MNEAFQKNLKLARILAAIAAVLIVVSYFVPIWWVSLQSVQYPKSIFPRGIRIDFKFNGVYNGCKGQKEREELAQTEASADCFKEMNAINHYIGMYKIVPGRNWEERGKGKYPLYYVFETKKDAQGNDIIDPETGEPVKVDVTPGFLKFLDKLMIATPYLFAVFVLLVILFIAVPNKVLAWAALIPGLLPFYFLLFYIIGLYWYGHNLSLHGGGAFRGIKPFMPTVFGEGKVAQFTTHSYPYWGFFVTLLVFVLLLLAIIYKKKALKAKQAEAAA